MNQPKRARNFFHVNKTPLFGIIRKCLWVATQSLWQRLALVEMTRGEALLSEWCQKPDLIALNAQRWVALSPIQCFTKLIHFCVEVFHPDLCPAVCMYSTSTAHCTILEKNQEEFVSVQNCLSTILFCTIQYILVKCNRKQRKKDWAKSHLLLALW